MKTLKELEAIVDQAKKDIDALKKDKAVLDLDSITVRREEGYVDIRAKDNQGHEWYIFHLHEDGSYARYDGIDKGSGWKLGEHGHIEER